MGPLKVLARKPAKLEAWGRRGLKKSAQRRDITQRIRHDTTQRVRRSVRARAGGRCEDCGRPVQAARETEYPERWTDRVVLDIYHKYPCHRCGFLFTVVDAGWLEDDALGRIVQARFPAFYKDYSDRMRHSYWANHCPSCSALQGAFHIMEYGIGLDMDHGIDHGPDDSLTIAPWRPEKIDEGYVDRETVEWGNLHHIDENPSNNDPSNLRLLCVRCHAARHGKGAPGALPKSLIREEP